MWVITSSFFTMPFDSPMKQETKDFIVSKYDMKIDDPATEFYEMHLICSMQTIDITHYRFMSNSEA